MSRRAADEPILEVGVVAIVVIKSINVVVEIADPARAASQ